jgi:phosphoribosylamine--glycine ligase
MKILVVGGGAREHAIAWKIAQNPKVDEVFIAPGNAGTAALGENIPLNQSDLESFIKFARENRIDLTVVGPEGPLADGIVDRFIEHGLNIFGPTKNAAMIETSKVFAKELMTRAHIPQAKGAIFSNYEEARSYVLGRSLPCVIKADGLAAGKGVIIAQTIPEALQGLEDMMLHKKFGQAGEKVIIEEYLKGKEMSYFAFSDGTYFSPLIPACDYKKAFDGDKGPNTGGMGSYSPPYFYTNDLGKLLDQSVIAPLLNSMHQEGRPFKGVIYAGLMITDEGPEVLEFNARFGDPETQVILPLLKTDLVEIMLATTRGQLSTSKIEWTEGASMGVVLASAGYPDNYKIGFPIYGLDEIDKDVLVFHGGTKIDKGAVVTNGGRVITLVAKGKNLKEARGKVYANAARIKFEGVFYRRDIALVEG